MARSQQWYDNLSPSKRRRVKARMVNRAAFVGAGILIAYYVLPIDSPGVSGTVLLAVGLLLIAVIVVWQVRVIINSPFPRVQVVQAILAGNPLAALRFATCYYVVGCTRPTASPSR